jgi:hypothetical protein
MLIVSFLLFVELRSKMKSLQSKGRPWQCRSQVSRVSRFVCPREEVKAGSLLPEEIAVDSASLGAARRGEGEEAEVINKLAHSLTLQLLPSSDPSLT